MILKELFLKQNKTIPSTQDESTGVESSSLITTVKHKYKLLIFLSFEYLLFLDYRNSVLYSPPQG